MSNLQVLQMYVVLPSVIYRNGRLTCSFLNAKKNLTLFLTLVGAIDFLMIFLVHIEVVEEEGPLVGVKLGRGLFLQSGESKGLKSDLLVLPLCISKKQEICWGPNPNYFIF